jgi:CoA-transferase family III
MSLTGRSEGPALGGPAALVDLVERAAGVLHRRSAGRADVDGLALLGERAAIDGLSRRGEISCGGSTRLVRAADGWLAVSLARPDDVAALPAWLGCDVPVDDPWPTLCRAAAAASAAALDERAALLGLPMAAVASVAPPSTTVFDLPLQATHWPEPGATATVPPRARSIEGALVVDLSALWAGPLCGQLLAAAGARVVKVESTARPDGARQGPAAFFDLLNGTKSSVALDLHTGAGRGDLRRLLRAADVVIESSRPRALEHMGISARELLDAPSGPRVWVSITSHGRGEAEAQRVAFGDVAAAAGGLVARDARGPCFLADAVTDPLCGLVAAAAVLESGAAGGRWLLDVAMAPLAASVAGPALPVAGATAAPPRARPVVRPARSLGADTAAVLGGLPA